MSPQREKTLFVTIGATAPFDALLRSVLNLSFLNTLKKHNYTHLRLQYGGSSGPAIFDSFLREHDSPEDSGISDESRAAVDEKRRREDAVRRAGERILASIGAPPKSPARRKPEAQGGVVQGIRITGFDFDKSGLTHELRALQPSSTLQPSPPPQQSSAQQHSISSTQSDESVQQRESEWATEREQGTVLSHAGSGSILDALRHQIPCIVVPNPKLLHNHQLELAEELERLGYVVHGHLDDLSKAILEVEVEQWEDVESGVDGKGTRVDEEQHSDPHTYGRKAGHGKQGLRARLKAWPPVNSGQEMYSKQKGSVGGGKGGLERVLDEEMGWVD